MASEDYRAVQAFLALPATHGLAQPPRCIRTHAAWVVLAGPLAYKLKLPVRYAYLDFSTPQKRRAMLERELQVNRELGSTLYRDVVPVTRQSDGRLAIQGGGTPVEWVMRMRRFDDEALLDRVAERHGIDEALAARLGQLVAQQHRSLVPQTQPDAADRVQALWRDLAQSLDTLARDREACLLAGNDAAQAVQRWSTLMEAALTQCQDLLNRRGQQGWVRRCHGDLHLGNLALVDGVPQTFDALEFDESLATIDVWYDIAFLLMDLAHRGEHAAAGHVLSRYLLEWNQVEVEEGLATLPLFMSLRAAVRAMVTAQRGSLPNASPDLASEARRYLDAAIHHLQVAPPLLVGVGGLSGTGKSTLARELVTRLDAQPAALLLRSDLLRKRLWHCAELEPLPEAAYTSDVTDAVYQQLRDQAARALQAGMAVIVDAVHLQPTERSALAEVASRADVPFVGIWLEAPEPELQRRIAGRRGDASDADVAVLARQLRLDPGDISWQRCDATSPTRVEQVMAWVNAAREPA